MKKNVFIVILVIIILGMGGYLVYDKVLSKDKVREEKSNETVTNEDKSEKNDEFIDLSIDSSKSLNTKDIKYLIDSNPSFNINVYSMLDQNNQKKFGVWYDKELLESYNIDNSTGAASFNKEISYDENVVDIYVAGFGQAVGRETVLFLKSDGTVEFMPVYSAVKNDDFRIYGKLDGVEKVIKFMTVSASDGFTGWRTTLAQRADGTFYDLNELLPTTEGYYY